MTSALKWLFSMNDQYDVFGTTTIKSMSYCNPDNKSKIKINFESNDNTNEFLKKIHTRIDTQINLLSNKILDESRETKMNVFISYPSGKNKTTNIQIEKDKEINIWHNNYSLKISLPKNKKFVSVNINGKMNYYTIDDLENILKQTSVRANISGKFCYYAISKNKLDSHENTHDLINNNSDFYQINILFKINRISLLPSAFLNVLLKNTSDDKRIERITNIESKFKSRYYKPKVSDIITDNIMKIIENNDDTNIIL